MAIFKRKKKADPVLPALDKLEEIAEGIIAENKENTQKQTKLAADLREAAAAIALEMHRNG